MDRDIDLSFERIREDDDEVFGMSKQSKRRSRRDDKDEKEEEEDFEEVETSTERWIPEDAAISVSNSLSLSHSTKFINKKHTYRNCYTTIEIE